MVARRGAGTAGFLGWLRIVLAGLAMAVGVTALVLGVSSGGLRLPRGLALAAWILLLAAAFVWCARLADSLGSRRVAGFALDFGGIVGHALLLTGLAAGPPALGLAGVFSLFLAAGEIIHLIELRAAGAGAGRSNSGGRAAAPDSRNSSGPGTAGPGFLLPPGVRVGLAAGALGSYLLVVAVSLL
jgi:hypothetical protein